jgi:hypothetical protein
VDTTFRELAAESRIEAVPLSHLSIELGHLYMEDFAAGPERLRSQFTRVAPWARTAKDAIVAGLDTRRKARVSTCFLIDDYFTRFSSPAEVVPVLQATAQEAGLDIDYLARESACATAKGIALAELVAGRLTPLPPEETNGSRPPVQESGWLPNGSRSPDNHGREAMRGKEWLPPSEIGARNHSVFVDVELWHDRGKSRLYSCAFLASIWQLLRLGVLRSEGASVVRPVPIGAHQLTEDWDDLPPILRLRENAPPFCGYRTFSVLPSRFLQVEHAVRVILSQFVPQPEILDQITERGTRDGMAVSRDVTERVDYVFFNGA